MPQAFSILFGAGFTVAVCLALGRLLLARLKLTLYREEELPLAFLAGAPLLSLLVFLLAAARLVYDGVFLALGALVVGWAWREQLYRLAGERLPPVPRSWRRLSLPLFALFGLLYFCHAMAPEMSPDGSTYHLGLVGRYYRAHGFERITTHMYANLSQGVEMLYLFAYAFGRHSAAALVHFAFLAALAWAMVGYGKRFGFGVAGLAGAAFFFFSPVAGMDGTTAYNDVAVAALIFAVFYLMAIWDESRNPAWLVPAGLLAGFCYASKYTAFLAVPYALAFAGWKLYRARQPWLRPVAAMAACAVLMMAPWLIKNWLWLDNPFSPFFNRLFPNPYIHVSFEQHYAEHMRNYEGLASRWQIPLEVTVRGAVLCGLIGPLFLLAPLALGALRRPHGRRLLAAALIFGSTYAANIGTRFLLPALPFLSLALALAVVRVRALAMALVLAHAILSWPDVLRTYSHQYAWRLEKVLWREALRIKSEDEFLRSNFPGYAVARLVEEVVPPGEKVLTFTQIPEAYTSREILVVYQSAFNENLGDVLWTPHIPEAQPTRRLEFHFPATRLRKLRVVQTASGFAEHWSIAEFRVLSGSAELARSPGWRLRASPNPWDVQRAFDGSPATRWRSWQSLFDGMFVEVDLGEEATVDGVELDSAADQWHIRLRLEGTDEQGGWRTLAEAPTETRRDPPPGLRRMAVLEIKYAGVRYLLIHENEFGKDDYLQRKQEWGLTLAGEIGGKRLYRID
jgi:hypothetical protein